MPNARAFALTLAFAGSLLGAAHGADAQASSSSSDERYFQAPARLGLSFGTDTALTLSNLERPSTNQTNSGSSNFETLWMRLYGHLRYGDKAELVVDVFAEDRRRPTLFGAYLRLQPSEAFGLRVGLIPLTVGAWQDRATPGRQPLINQPLSSQSLTALRNDALPASLDELLGQRGRGRDTRYPRAATRLNNAVTLAYEHCWDTGLEAFGRIGRVRYRVAVAEGTPGAPAAKVRGRKSGASLQGRLTWQATSALRLGGSYARGPYLLDDLESFLPGGARLRDFRQQLAGADARLKSGPLEVHAEWLWNRYDSPFVGPRLRTQGYTGEISYELWHGLRAAVRLSGLQHGHVRDGRGALVTWDADARRIETGLAYRFAADRLALKGVFQRTEVDLLPRRVEDLVALQLSFSR